MAIPFLTLAKSRLRPLEVAVQDFRRQPGPETADALLKVLGPMRGDSARIREMLDTVLEFKHQVGSIPEPERKVPPDQAVP